MAKRLTRNRRDAILGGVASGYGDYFDIDPVLVRLGFILLCFLNGIGVIFYLVSWVVMPVDDRRETTAPPADGAAPPPDDEIGRQTEKAVNEVREATEKVADEVRHVSQKLADGVKATGERVIADVRRSSSDGGRGGLIAGIVLILIGMAFLVDQIPWLHWPHWIHLSSLWPLILIGIGFAMLLGARRGGRP
jgi:phage shock protein C